ncbi:alanine--glyoxylate aminotransferase family protein [Motiliproteus sp. MSK22-1]|uniref:pyridoxal-phosphate-dependent aminotransferase family protein n=1 Tax=Motiliproteus sp. MSK22-1 TaxID=1897630 RepID=UPI00097590F3|nr:alanine--glyoxylate aminotransferase family protein [Motiliproteus sp. MSK22-1]OMH34042.1 alanine--glyoxylate aminotransferase [Motiliproteus sp. MSK22-1]
MAIEVPQVEHLNRILPEEPLLMMGAGPVPIPAPVAAANGIVINHLGETMARVTDQVKRMGRYIFQTESEWLMGVAGPGSAAMEMAVANLVWPGTRVLSVCNGFFSSRLAEMASRAGAEVEKLQVAEGQGATPDSVEALLKRYRPQVLTIVQGETSNTTHNHALPEIAALARQYDCQVIVDAVCTLSTMPLEMDKWGIDAVITGGQKGLSSIPGVSLVAFSNNAWQRILSRPEPMRHWTLDATLATNFWHRASYHYTAPVSGLLALHEAMRLVCEETLEKRFNRHMLCSRALQAAIATLGLELYVSTEARLNSVVGIKLPNGLEAKDVCAHISKYYRVEIAGSFGPPIVRIGQMGEQCRVHNLFRTLHAFGSTFKELGIEVDVPAGMAELENQLQKTSNERT